MEPSGILTVQALCGSYEARHTSLLFLFVTFFGLDCALSSKIHVSLNLLSRRNVALVLSSQNW